VGLAQALIHDPEILILDEPTSGLDPNQIVEIRNLISELGKEKTLMLSTHILQEVAAICDRVIIINKGKIVADEPMNTTGIAELENKFRELTST
jgi:ABC-2 type transport system ATP-binding protein